jgi:hypothetical protein
LTFGFFVQELPAKLGTPLAVGSCYVLSVCYQVALCCLDQGADLGQHVWGLDTHMPDDVGKLSDLFSLTLLQDLFLHLPAYLGSKWLHLEVNVVLFSDLPSLLTKESKWLHFA